MSFFPSVYSDPLYLTLAFSHSSKNNTLFREPMPIGEKISLRFEVACGKPVIYEWLKQGVKEDITVSPPECKIRSSITPIAIGKELTGKEIEKY